MENKTIRYKQSDIFYQPPKQCKAAWEYLRKHKSIVNWDQCNSYDFINCYLAIPQQTKQLLKKKKLLLKRNSALS